VEIERFFDDVIIIGIVNSITNNLYTYWKNVGVTYTIYIQLKFLKRFMGSFFF